MRIINGLIAILFMGLTVFHFSAQAARVPSTAEVKADSLHYLQELRAQNNKRLVEIQSALQKEDENEEKSHALLKSALREHTLRQDFLDRLILQIDTKFQGGDLRNFIEVALQEIKKVDQANASNEAEMGKFLGYAAETLHRLPEKKENVLSFLEDYLNHSVSNPVAPEDYVSSRNYTNGSASDSGKPMERSEAGALAERRMKQLSDGTTVFQKRRR